ncbi:uncharacterized protein J3D65DRAFT_639622 [Phyllosticta citribraziliensis]|uniref:Uncharacterized protein n=1 Tax=Phyllosticta citribraziliensis TaxID=989973 RepID=A0ABR1LAG9_9PEZI
MTRTTKRRRDEEAEGDDREKSSRPEKLNPARRQRIAHEQPEESKLTAPDETPRQGRDELRRGDEDGMRILPPCHCLSVLLSVVLMRVRLSVGESECCRLFTCSSRRRSSQSEIVVISAAVYFMWVHFICQRRSTADRGSSGVSGVYEAL